MTLIEVHRWPLSGFFPVLFSICLTAALAQDQRVADSLKVIYAEGNYSDEQALELLRALAFNERSDLQQAEAFAESLLEIAVEKNDLLYQYRGHLQKGQIKLQQGDLELALEDFFRSLDAAKRADYQPGVGAAHSSIADIYSINGNSSNAVQYYNLAIDILRNNADTLTLASVLLNAGEEYFRSGTLDSASTYFAESKSLFEKLDYPIGIAYNMGNSGMVYAEEGRDDDAKEAINDAITILEELEDYYAISDYLTYVSDIYFKQKDLSSAIEYAQRSLSLSQKYGLKEQISKANQKLATYYEYIGDQNRAYSYFKAHIHFRDSVNNIQSVQQMADMRTQFEVSQKQIEVDLLNQQKKTQQVVVLATSLALFLIALLAFGLYKRYLYINRTKKIIEIERNRSDALLLNILPQETAKELKSRGKVQAKKFDLVSVLFTDFKGFTQLAEKLPPELLVENLDLYFTKFDDIVVRHGLEKIKTIGDAYMCVSGLPDPVMDHAHRALLAAFDMIDVVAEMQSKITSHTPLEIRVGINSGPVVAGVVGSKKFAYDIWGDTVNIASRMESNSEPGRINISEHTYQMVKDIFPCTYRGEIVVKNRGALRMYFAERSSKMNAVRTINI